MTISFISKYNKVLTHFAHFNAETISERMEIIEYYKQEVKNGNIYGFSVIG